MTTTDVNSWIQHQINSNDVVLFMKGTKMMPQCGFSGRVTQILNFLAVDFRDVNVLADPAVRDGIKTFSNWPTIPQLYIKGEFIGGADIASEMFKDGELQKLLAEKGVEFENKVIPA